LLFNVRVFCLRRQCFFDAKSALRFLRSNSHFSILSFFDQIIDAILPMV
jgi:hypothetical protein